MKMVILIFLKVDKGTIIVDPSIKDFVNQAVIIILLFMKLFIGYYIELSRI